jgi:hypothetical protein
MTMTHYEKVKDFVRAKAANPVKATGTTPAERREMFGTILRILEQNEKQPDLEAVGKRHAETVARIQRNAKKLVDEKEGEALLLRLVIVDNNKTVYHLKEQVRSQQKLIESFVNAGVGQAAETKAAE